jgi:hypothetical protein
MNVFKAFQAQFHLGFGVWYYLTKLLKIQYRNYEKHSNLGLNPSWVQSYSLRILFNLHIWPHLSTSIYSSEILYKFIYKYFRMIMSSNEILSLFIQ